MYYFYYFVRAHEDTKNSESLKCEPLWLWRHDSSFYDKLLKVRCMIAIEKWRNCFLWCGILRRLRSPGHRLVEQSAIFGWVASCQPASQIAASLWYQIKLSNCAFECVHAPNIININAHWPRCSRLVVTLLPINRLSHLNELLGNPRPPFKMQWSFSVRLFIQHFN